MTNNQKIQEFEKVMDKGFIDYFGSQTGGFVPKHYKERFKSFLLSALEQKDQEKDKALEEIIKALNNILTLLK